MRLLVGATTRTAYMWCGLAALLPSVGASIGAVHPAHGARAAEEQEDCVSASDLAAYGAARFGSFELGQLHACSRACPLARRHETTASR